MKWETNTQRVPSDQHWGRCGHLYVRVEDNGDECEWFVEPDDEDKSYRRALATGSAPSVDEAKQATQTACESLIADMLLGCSEPLVPVTEGNRDITYHLEGIQGDEGENPGVLAITALLNTTPNDPEYTHIILGAPPKSPLMEGYIPDLKGGFSMSVETAQRFIAVLQRAIRDVVETRKP